MRVALSITACVVAFSVAASLMAQPADAPKPAAPPAPAKPAAAQRSGDAYPLPNCPISDSKLGSMGDAVVKIYEGREIRFCCKSCPPKFEKDLPKNLAMVDAAIIKDQAPIYPLKTSVVSGKELPAKPLDFVHGNRLVRVADESEKAEFLKDPAKHIAELDKAVVAAQGKDYPLSKCPVSDEALGSMGKPLDVVLGGRLVRLCCKSCRKDLDKDPAKFIAMIDAARKSTPAPAKPAGK